MTPRTVVHQAPLSMGFLRQEYWRGLPFPSPVDLPDQGNEPVFPAFAGEFFTTEPPGKRQNKVLLPLSPVLPLTSTKGSLSSRPSAIHGHGWLLLHVLLFLLKTRNASLWEPKCCLGSRCHTHLTGLCQAKLLPRLDSEHISLIWAVSPSHL